MTPEVAIVPLRLAQYLGGMILLGSPLFFLYGVAPTGRWAGRLVAAAAVLTLASAALGLLAQTALMAGSWAAGLTAEALHFMVSGTGLGRAAVTRVAAAGLALPALLLFKPGPARWAILVGLGAVVCASFAWSGHGGATEGIGGTVHLISTAVHALAAAVWIGALAGFLGVLATASPEDRYGLGELHRALEGFAGVGSAMVAALIGTGLVNSLFLVGFQRLDGLWTTPYGGLLLTKLALFAGMLALAAGNRFRLAPALRAALDDERSPIEAVRRLRLSLLLETLAAVLVLALVAWLGTLAPISAL